MQELPQLLKSLVVWNSLGRSSRPIGLHVSDEVGPSYKLNRIK
jgi:hypothetical protein